MWFRKLMATSLAVALVFGSASLLAQQGAISGQATDEAESPYSEYSVRLVRPETGEIVSSQVLDSEGRFAFTGLTIDQNLLVELIDTAEDNEVVCSEGPFGLTQDITSHSGINIDCGGPPAALWLVAGAAGLVTAVGILTQSNPQ
jgi:hypothetical protein